MKAFSLLRLSAVLILFGLQACHLVPFAKYSMNKEGFKNFSKKEELAGNNSNPDRNYKLNRYDWDIEIFPESKKIEGEMDITITALSNQKVFLFDLQKRLKIRSITSSIGEPQVKRKGDLLYLSFEQDIPEGKRLTLKFEYGGKPVIIMDEGPIQWKTDQQMRPWISTVTEGIGPQFLMPCNALLKAEADTTTIRITVPEDLTAVANGRLISSLSIPDKGMKTFRYEVNNPINIYNISFNIGHFEKITKPYVDINGVARILEFQVLDYHKAVADTFYDQVPEILREFELLFGAFPWWNDGCKFVESTFAAMEHQSAIAMGDDYRLDWKDYNLTLIHEIAHEWWGNNITGKDYCDIWLHEGMATYCEALFLEKVYGKADYERRLGRAVMSVYNTIPILKKCDVLYNSWTNGPDQDIYDKGALMISSLRYKVDNDSLFLASLFQIQQKFARSNVSTTEVIESFNTLLKDDYSALFDWYLNKTKPPVLDVLVDREGGKLSYKWKEDVSFMKGEPIYIQNGEELMELTPTMEFQSISIEKGVNVSFFVAKSVYYMLEVEKV